MRDQFLWLLLVLTTTVAWAAPPAEKGPAYPSDIRALWGKEEVSAQLDHYLAPHLTPGQLTALRSTELLKRIEPGIALDPCRASTQLAYSEYEPDGPFIGVCMRNIAYFSHYLAMTSTALFVNDKYQKDSDLEEYAKLFGNTARETRNARLTREVGLPLPCLYFEFLALRRMGPNAGTCSGLRRVPPAVIDWVRSKADFLDLELLDSYAAKARISRPEVINLGASGTFKQANSQMIAFAVLHEVAHVVLGHLQSEERKTCALVRQEHEADGFAEKVIIQSNIAKMDEIRTKQAFWVIYQAANYTSINDTQRLQFDNVRRQAAYIYLLESVQRASTDESLPESVRSSMSRDSSQKVAEALAEITSLRTCIGKPTRR